MGGLCDGLLESKFKLACIERFDLSKLWEPFDVGSDADEHLAFDIADLIEALFDGLPNSRFEFLRRKNMLLELILQEAVVAVFIVPWKFVQDQFPLALESKDRVGEGRYVVEGFAEDDLDSWITLFCEPLDFGFGLLKMLL